MQAKKNYPKPDNRPNWKKAPKKREKVSKK